MYNGDFVKRFGQMLLAVYAIGLLQKAQAGSSPVQLESSNFTSFVESVPSNQAVLMEFYAHWCPTCQHFQPTYEKIAQYFNVEPKVKPEVMVARVDCATQTSLCNEFSVSRYPTLKFGPPTAFKEGQRQLLEEFTRDRTAVQIIKWIGELKGVRYNFDSSQAEQEDRSSVAVAQVGTEAGVPLVVSDKADLEDIEKATVLAFKYALDTPELLKGVDSQRAFRAFTELVASAHPIPRCRQGAQKLSAAIPQLWPDKQINGPNAALKDVAVCGEEAAPEEWKACKGSKPNTRGYTCGLWMLLHSLAGRQEAEETGGRGWMLATKGYIKHFFQCSDCAKHFTEMASEAAAEAVTTQKEAVLWAWRAHNEVNRRLEAVEKSSGEGDPSFPKKQWPPSELCPLCRLPSLSPKQTEVTWNEEEVYRFLIGFYHSAPDPGWALGLPLASGSRLFGLGGRRSLELRRSSGRSWHVMPLLAVAVLLAGGVFLARQRMRRSRKTVSL